MTIDDLVRVFSGGFCHGEKRAECETCQTRERAIERVRRMDAVIAAARRRVGPCVYRRFPGCGTCDACVLTAALAALDGES